MTLHCIYSPASLDADGPLQAAIADGDAILLLDSACWLAVAAPKFSRDIRLFALADDLAAHGISATCDTVESVDYDGWVALTEKFPRQQVWA